MSLWLVLSMLMPLALTLLSVALYRLCQFLSMFFSLGNVVLRSGFILCRQCFPDCGYSISSIPWPFYSRQFHFMPVPSAFLSILYAALWRSAVPYINFILCIFIHYTKSSFHLACVWIHRPFSSMFSSISPLSFPCSFPFHLCAYWVAWHLSTHQPFHLLIMVLFILCWFAPKWHVRSI